MTKILSEQEAQDFYVQWAPSVLTYCRLYLGDRDLAERATQAAFARFFQAANPFASDRIPVLLLRGAFDAAQSWCSLRQRTLPEDPELEEVIPLLPCEERAVFVMRGTLRQGASEVASVTGLSKEKVNSLWVQALLHVRKLLLKR